MCSFWGVEAAALLASMPPEDDPLATVKQTLHPKYIRPAPLRP